METFRIFYAFRIVLGYYENVFWWVRNEDKPSIQLQPTSKIIDPRKIFEILTGKSDTSCWWRLSEFVTHVHLF